MVATIKNYKVRLILTMVDIIFFLFLKKYRKGHISGYFEGVKKVEAPTKYPLKCPIMYFIHKKLINRIFKINGTLIVKISLGDSIVVNYSQHG
jgi:hypothetical protein